MAMNQSLLLVQKKDASTSIGRGLLSHPLFPVSLFMNGSACLFFFLLPPMFSCKSTKEESENVSCEHDEAKFQAESVS